ncbi:hypothetical protein [Nocardiopsis sp. TNDT3]|uniref:hypothetical protein n=1 Tax=Nocardiopsis sp. TNDT3 TaxID=2249354 RepID=UPI000E3C2C67|nr:hypothetical protein [Nocardiopsis sp. TNDT3]
MLTTLVCVLATLFAFSGTALADSAGSASPGAQGRACLFLSTSAAYSPSNNGGIPMGHTAWAVKDPGKDHWLWGTMNGPGTGGTGSMGGFISSGSFAELRSSTIIPHASYNYVRCIDTPDGDIDAAYDRHRSLTQIKFDAFRQNCLISSVKILHAYSLWLDQDDLPTWNLTAHPPRLYFNGDTPGSLGDGWDEPQPYHGGPF